MKKSVLNIVVVAFVALFSVSVSSVNAQSLPEFLYNTYEENGVVTSKEICKLNSFDNTHKRHILYEYTYTDNGMLKSRKASYWNEKRNAWEHSAIILYSYNELLNDVTLEYAEWNDSKNDFDSPIERAVYQLSNEQLISSYTLYEKDNSEINWSIKEHFSLDTHFIAYNMQ
ncbi:hypothetical protein M2459_002969 [Parabacteroides sp. PF5-5]|uniref:DUF3836 domain-containing protein n=1 Tax=unclassified Parabacteroides TaxID=2649774 RepID=UPI002476E5B7|nr:MULTISPECIES: DUF3836 domain-containing protein [unclassified Parabacteroides]MDH6305958.1 hypothetical protein [Parabacteroides sp. PH5-39]MDH6317214.1 hypothetical protein [Parabacteroides sp. PF5-13]MDH6320670.1 hypothetical protein [Parabacteroides sp. PH5-13]MDH6324409.1 hypothetical protein [Parabacteroides sp. PH5-8]MDH6328399.1 hypothetical protein [Parabacteroides sp. PH5-41]